MRPLGAPRVADESVAIVERMAAGDSAALAELYELYRKTLISYLHLMTPDHGLVEEIVQDTLLAAWRGASGYARQGSVRSWLLAIARRRASDALRRQEPRAADSAVLEHLPTQEPDPEDVVLAEATLETIVAALERLSPMHQEVLVLAFVHGLSYRELAEVLAVPTGTVKSRLSNAKRALRALLHESD